MRAAFLWALTALTAVYAQKFSKTGRCGAANGGLVCTGSSFGNCCSSNGWCGSTSLYCGTGCNSAYGTCTALTKKISTDGSCGGTKRYTCKGSIFGNCCSSYGYCGLSSVYCSKGCNAAFGICSTGGQSSNIRSSTTLQSVIRSSSVAAPASPSSSAKVSTNARCGYAHSATGGFNCLGSKFGDCCSQYSYCGSTSDYCGTGCQAGFGKCNSASLPVRSSSSLVPSFSLVLSSSSSFSVSTSTVYSSVSTESASASSSQPIESSSSLVSSSSESSQLPLNTPVSSSVEPTNYDSSSSLSIATSSSVASSTGVSLSSVASSTDQSSSFSATSSMDVSSSTVSSTDQSSSFSIPAVSSAQSTSVDPVVVPTPSSSPTRSCLVAPTNYVTNGGFESGTGTPFVFSTIAGTFSFSTTGGHSGQYFVRGFHTNSNQRSTANIQQRNIMIPSGTKVNVFAFARSLRTDPSGIQRWRIFLDDVNLGTITASNGDWTKVGGLTNYTVVGDSHLLLFTIENEIGAPSSSAVFEIDDFSIAAVSGPDGSDICDTLSPSSSAASSIPIQSSESLSESMTQFPSVSASAVDSVTPSSTPSPFSTLEPTPSSSVVDSSTSSSLAVSSESPSSTPEPSPSSSSGIQSSTPEPSPSSSSEVESSTLIPAPTPTLTPSCYSAPTNYLTNPGFESYTGAVQSPWVLTAPLVTQWFGPGTQVFSGFQNSGANGFTGYTFGTSSTTSTLTLEQTVTIPIGVKVKVGVWFQSLRSVHSANSPFLVSLKVDGIQFVSWNPSSSLWKEIAPASNALLGTTATTSTHTITLTVTSKGVSNQVVFAVDDFYISPISGPNGETICTDL